MTFGYSLESSLESFIQSNAAPSHDDCTLIKESLLSLSTKSAQLRDIIAEQEEAIAKLSLTLHRYEDSREEMLFEQSRVQNLIERHRQALSSPIWNLPIDIMREIFFLASTNAADVTDFPWTATHVCREWRAIATQTPTLWSKIHIITNKGIGLRTYHLTHMHELKSCLSSTPLSKETVGCSKTVGRVLELSGDVPLVVSFLQPFAATMKKPVVPDDIKMLDLLLDHAPRWKVAYIKFDHFGSGKSFRDRLRRLRGRAPMLERIAIEVSLYPTETNDFLAVSPQLSTVVMRDYWGDLVFPWQQIQRLVFNGMHERSYLHDVLRSAQNVEHLTFCPVDVTDHVVVNTGPTHSIILPAVVTLDLLSDKNILFLSSKIVLPALRQLRVEKGIITRWRDTDNNWETHAITPEFMNDVYRLLKSSRCPLTYATFSPIVKFGPVFRKVITLCPTLTYLDVGFIPPREDIDGAFSFLNQENILPALRTLKLNFRISNLSEDCPCIGKRFTETAIKRSKTLRVIMLSLYMIADEEIPDTALLGATDQATLENLKAEGMSVTFRSTTKGRK
ncbi:hypothetical protein ARMGADRAFT_1082130 [Armillaria gallica]|uniref:Uncharacterized protein n=1 Tax=Armillaria gallica TaxID=47427 RepID=A0A2H3DP81_ARMGA|nr:hypothetical protein ARMGADRAFT_1082130 [Armillaria gallica]